VPETTETRVLLALLDERLGQSDRRQEQHNQLVISELQDMTNLIRAQNGRIGRLEACDSANQIRWKSHEGTHKTERGLFGGLIAIGSAIAGWVGFSN